MLQTAHGVPHDATVVADTTKRWDAGTPWRHSLHLYARGFWDFCIAHKTFRPRLAPRDVDDGGTRAILLPAHNLISRIAWRASTLVAIDRRTRVLRAANSPAQVRPLHHHRRRRRVSPLAFFFLSHHCVACACPSTQSLAVSRVAAVLVALAGGQRSRLTSDRASRVGGDGGGDDDGGGCDDGGDDEFIDRRLTLPTDAAN